MPIILSNIVSSQVEVHKDFGGVVPELAARSHIEKIDLIIKKAVDESGIETKRYRCYSSNCWAWSYSLSFCWFKFWKSNGFFT